MAGWMRVLRRQLQRVTAVHRARSLARTASGLCGGLLILSVLLMAVAPAPAADGATSQATGLQIGAQLFEAHCIGCHVNGGNVIRRGRTLKRAALEKAGLADPEAIARIAAGGIGQMSGYGSVLGDEGALRLGEWVWLQARAGWPHPARMEELS